jgi:Zn-dependent M28 family amino/carboxypeptidase
VYSAHSDHIGFAKTVKKFRINNGAMDNASGTSVLMETARLFSQLDERPKRSILFVAVAGEKKGYWVQTIMHKTLQYRLVQW